LIFKKHNIHLIQIYRNSSIKNTIVQQETETTKRLAPYHASRIPISSAAQADQILPVASRIAGNVITVNVT